MAEPALATLGFTVAVALVGGELLDAVLFMRVSQTCRDSRQTNGYPLAQQQFPDSMLLRRLPYRQQEGKDISLCD
jgi:hypothetical protein